MSNFAISKAKQQLPFIDLAAQQDRLRPMLEQRMQAVMRHGIYIMGPEIKELEGKLAEYVGVKHCLTVASGTAGLEIALRALGIGPGDEVVVPPFTWISTAEVVSAVGAKPVFVDIDLTTYNMNPDLLEAAFTPRTKAIVPVSLFGQMADFTRINALAAQKNIPVIEDGAQSFGATQNGRRSCGVTPIACTSFFPAKPLGCYGDGGALFTNDDSLADVMRAIRTHGGVKRHYHTHVGMNGRLDTLQAAILLAKLTVWDEEVLARHRIGARYSELLGSSHKAEKRARACLNAQACAGTKMEDADSSIPRPNTEPVVPAIFMGNTHVYAQYTIRVKDREKLAGALQDQGIPTAVYYPKCLHEQPVFANLGCKWEDFPASEQAGREVLSLPMHPYLKESDQDRIVSAIRNSLSC